MRFIFVDRILKLEKGKYAEGIKNVSFSDEYLVHRVSNFPVMPRSLTVEAIAQLISWLVIFTTDFSVKPIAVTTEETKFLGDVRPGDQMLLKAEINSMHEEDALCSGSAEVNGKIVTELKNGICAFIPIEELEDVSVVKEMSFSLFPDRSFQDFLDYKKSNPGTNSHFHRNKFDLNAVDKVLKIENGKRILGVKSFTMTEDFGSDHFPVKPVMPGTMIIEAFVQLSERLLSSTIKEKTGAIIKIIPKGSRKIKFRRYVRPGDQMILEVNLSNLQDDTAVVKAKATVHGETAASAQIEFDIINVSY